MAQCREYTPETAKGLEDDELLSILIARAKWRGSLNYYFNGNPQRGMHGQEDSEILVLGAELKRRLELARVEAV